MGTRKFHLTKKAIAAFAFRPQNPQARDIRWDASLRGFGVRVFPSGTKVFVFRYTALGRVRRILTIGHVGELTLEQARRRAQRMRGDLASGVDPADERAAQRSSITLNELATRYLAQHADQHKKPSSAAEDRRNLRLHVLPALGSRPLQSIKPADVERLKGALGSKPIGANRVIALLSKMFNLAAQWGLLPDGENPCRHIKRFAERRRDRFLTADELATLGRVLNEFETSGKADPNIVLAIRLLVLTGCRRDEILNLRWSEVRLDQSQLWLEDSKTGRKAVWLPVEAVEALRAHPSQQDNPFVIRGRKQGSRLQNLERPWQRIRAAAGLHDVRLHDLRHTYASVAAAGGLSLPVIGGLLGHRNVATTQRYAHLGNSVMNAASAMVGNQLGALLALGGRSEANGRHTDEEANSSPPTATKIAAE